MTTAFTQVRTPKASAWIFALLFMLESLVRSFNLGVLSIQAYDILGSSQKVSVLATVTSFVALTVSLTMPFLFGKFPKRNMYILGAVLAIAGSVCLASFTVQGQIAGTIMRSVGASLLAVTLQLYILDIIRKSDLTSSEPLRLAFSTIAWVAGPVSGVWLYTHYGSLAPQVVAITAALVLLMVFLYIRLPEKKLALAASSRPFRPLSNALHFFKQPRLRLAWAIAFGRSCFWASFFTYSPALFLQAGLSKPTIGYILSASQLFLMTAFLFGALAKRIGVRGVIALCFSMMALASILAGAVGTHAPYVTTAFLLCAAFFTSGLDSIGGIPYLRAVKPLERNRMTSVYRSFIECSELLPGLVFAFALSYFETPIVFILLGISFIGFAIMSWWHLPKSM
jgi:MFS family permease